MKRTKLTGGQDGLTRRQLLGFATGAAALAALAACTPSTPTTSTAAPSAAAASPAKKAGGQAVISLGEPDSLLSTASRALVFSYIRSFIANGMVRLKYPDMIVVPDLADAFTASPDGKIYTFNLHPKVKWQDGNAFSSEDAKFTLEFFCHPQNPAPMTTDFANIVGAKEFKNKLAGDVTGIKISGDKVEISLLAPSPTFLTSVAVTTLLPKHILKDVAPADFAKHAFARKPVYTGPFKVDEWKTGESITYSAFVDHFRGRPNLDKIVQRIYPDPSAPLADLRTGILQQGFVTADQYAEFKSNANFATQELAGTTGWFLSWDMTNKTFPFGERDFRIAMSHAVDRATLASALFKGLAEPSYSLASPLSWVANANAPKYAYDPAKSRQLLDGLGWKVGPDGIRVKNGQRLEFATVLTTTTRDWFLAIQPMLQAIGVGTSKVDVVDFGTWVSRLAVGKYEQTMNGWGNFAIDPRADLANHFNSPTKAARGDATGYKSEQVDQLFLQAARAATRDEEKRLYDQIQSIADGDCVYGYLFRPKVLNVNAKNVRLPQAKIQAEVYDGMPTWEVG